jgi:hypothetical protein
MPVPTRAGAIIDLHIITLYDCTAVNGLPLDLLVEGRATNDAPLKRFGVLFADASPEDKYPLPVLWMCDGRGNWIVPDV